MLNCCAWTCHFHSSAFLIHQKDLFCCLIKQQLQTDFYFLINQLLIGLLLPENCLILVWQRSPSLKSCGAYWDLEQLVHVFSVLVASRTSKRCILVHSRHFCPTSDTSLLAPSQASGRISFMLLSPQLLAQRRRFAPNSRIALRKKSFLTKLMSISVGEKKENYSWHIISACIFVNQWCCNMQPLKCVVPVVFPVFPHVFLTCHVLLQTH